MMVASEPRRPLLAANAGSRRNCDQSQTEALPASVRGVTFVVYPFRSGRFGSLAKFTANRGASSRVSRFGRHAARRSDMSEIGGEAEVRDLRLNDVDDPFRKSRVRRNSRVSV